MWYAIKTPPRQEEALRELLLKQEGITDVYMPLCRKTVKGPHGEEKTIYRPTISRILMVSISERQMGSLLDYKGRMLYKEPARNPETGLPEEKSLPSEARLISARADRPDTPLHDLVSQARITERDMERLRLFNDAWAENMGDLRMEEERYDLIEAENDTVLITDGPLKGLRGVVKRVKEKGGKDRRLFFSLGGMTLSLGRAHDHQQIVIKEARRGEKAREVETWRAIDRLIGRLQALQGGEAAADPRRDGPLCPSAPAAETLRALLLAPEAHKDITQQLPPAERRLLAKLRQALGTAGGKSLELLASQLIADQRLRPFLTPTAGPDMAEGQDHITLHHDALEEIIIPTDLSPYFSMPGRGDGRPEAKPWKVAPTGPPAPPRRGKTPAVGAEEPAAADYTYYAHVAITDGGQTLVASWGDLMKQFVIKSPEEKEKFLRQIKEKGYSRLESLLRGARGAADADGRGGPSLHGDECRGRSCIGPPAAAGECKGDPSIGPVAPEGHTPAAAPDPQDIYIYAKDGIWGLALDIPDAQDPRRDAPLRASGGPTGPHPAAAVDILAQAHRLTEALIPAAVELWQLSALPYWRGLAQRHVLLHKEPQEPQADGT